MKFKKTKLFRTMRKSFYFWTFFPQYFQVTKDTLRYSYGRCGSKHMNRKSGEEREKEHYQRWIMELPHEDSFGIQEDPRYTVISAVLEMPNGA